MKIGILGSGDVGKALGAGFAQLGHDVKMASRNPNSQNILDWIAKAGSRASSGSFASAAAFGEAAVLATRWSGTENAIRLADPNNLSGKIVLDVTNPLVFSDNDPPGLALGHTDSGGEQVQRWLPKSRVVKVFNTVGNSLMVNPSFAGGPPTMFLCGNDDEAKKVTTSFCKDFGWDVIDIGDIRGARLLEPMCILWVTYGARAGSWNHAFKLLRK